MTAEQTSNMDDVNETKDKTQAVPKPGAQLKAAREQKNIEIEEVARALYITRHKVKAIEEDDYDNLNSTVFVKGYLRKYAPLVGLDGDDLVALYENEYEADAFGVDITEDDQDVPSTLVPKFVLPAVGVAIVAVIAFSFIFGGQDEMERQEPVAGNPEIDEALEQAEAARVLPIQEPITSNVEQASTNSSEEEKLAVVAAEDVADNNAVESIPSPTSAPQVNAQQQFSQQQAQTGVAGTRAATTEESSGNSNSQSLGNAELKFTFSEDCWLEVRDRIDNIIYTGVAEAGDNFELQGEPPFSLMLGNAEAVTLYLGDQLIDTQPQPGNRTARLVVGESITQ